MKEAAAQAQRARRAEAEATIAGGRRLLWIGTAVFGGADLLVNAALLFALPRDDEAVLSTVVRVSLMLIALVALHRGSTRAAKVVLTLFGLGGVLAVVMSFAAPASRPMVSVVSGAVGLAFVSTVVVLATSKDFWRYLAHLREKAAGRDDQRRT